MVMSLWPRFFWPTPYIWQAGSLWYHYLRQTRRRSHRLKFAITKMLYNGRWDLAWGLFSVTNIQPHLGRLNQLFLFTIFRLLLKLTELDVCEHTYYSIITIGVARIFDWGGPVNFHHWLRLPWTTLVTVRVAKNRHWKYGTHKTERRKREVWSAEGATGFSLSSGEGSG